MGEEELLALLQSAQYLLHSLIHLDELWQRSKPSTTAVSTCPWLAVAQDVFLCGELLTSLSVLQTLSHEVVGNDRLRDLAVSVESACLDCRALCMTLISDSDSLSRSLLVAQLLASALAVSSPSTATATIRIPSQSVESFVSISVMIAKEVLSACLNTNNYEQTFPPLLKIQTLQVRVSIRVRVNIRFRFRVNVRVRVRVIK
jgi:hypothetical protein